MKSKFCKNSHFEVICHYFKYCPNSINFHIDNPSTGEEIEYPVNPWYSLGYNYGYTDEFTSYTNEDTGDVFYDWIWRNPEGEIVAYGDRDFRDRVFGSHSRDGPAV